MKSLYLAEGDGCINSGERAAGRPEARIGEADAAKAGVPPRPLRRLWSTRRRRGGGDVPTDHRPDRKLRMERRMIECPSIAFTVRELIEALEEVAKEHGDDLPVLDAYDSPVRAAEAYDDDGDKLGKAVIVVLSAGN